MLLIIVILCCLPLAACDSNDGNTVSDFIADETHCVVALPNEYDIIYTNDEIASVSKFNKDLDDADTVNGKQKNDEFRYYNILKNEPFKILTPLSIIQNKNESGQTLVYWKVNDKLYKDGDNYYSSNEFSCAQDAEITPVYYEFRAVGMLFYEVDENDMPSIPDEDIFQEDGSIKEQDGLYYLYGVYDFEPYQEFWRTNLTINSYLINSMSKQVAENYYKDFYTINIEIDKGSLFDNGKIIVEKLYKIDGHGYMTYGALQLIPADGIIQTLSIGGHGIKYSFI